MSDSRTLWAAILSVGLLALSACSGGGNSPDAPQSSAQANNPRGIAANARALEPEATFTVTFTSLTDGSTDTIEIPNGRPVYALLVSGFHQNRNLDMFHYYNFAKCLFEADAYVHYAWWNNLLAPYMERPLHDEDSVPSTDGFPEDDIGGFLPGFGTPTKAIPAEDHQFQADATKLLTKIREHNPNAAIIVVGHSMGGDAVARLAANTDIDIDLLAPIDAVGNRTCLDWAPGSILTPWCAGSSNFTRFQTTHDDWYWKPGRRTFGANIKYLYYRWQQEFTPPFDWLCPGDEWWSAPGCFLLPRMRPEGWPDAYLFGHPDVRVNSIHEGSTNVQSRVSTSVLSGLDVPTVDVLGGPFDGHGEIVGFRGVIDTFWPNLQDVIDTLNVFKMLNVESYPLALKASDDWPSLDKEQFDNDGNDINEVRLFRIQLMKEWEADPTALDAYWGPTHPQYCMVSGDMCTILREQVNLAPIADAGPDQTLECSGHNGTPVTLDGSGSTDPNDDLLTFAWDGPFGTLTGEVISPDMPLGISLVTLTVDDGRGKSDSDTVAITVMDTTSPTLDVSLSPNTLWPPNHKLVTIDASLQVSDVCDANPNVELVSITSNEADNGLGDGDTSDDIQGVSYGTDDRQFLLRAERSGTGSGRIYTAIYSATDASGNATETTDEVTVPH